MAEQGMSVEEFLQSTEAAEVPAGTEAPLAALWWDAKQDWRQAHGLVDDLDSKEGMAVHAYLHRKEGDAGNAGYWYRRAGRTPFRGELEEEWRALVGEMLR